MNVNESPSRFASPGVTVRWLLRVLAATAMGVSGYLLWHSLFTPGTGIAGCGGEGGCDQVLASRWALWLGIPVSAPAVGVYGAMLLALGFIGPRTDRRTRKLAWSMLLLLSVMAGAAALFFSAMQIWSVGHLCRLCMTIHSSGLLAGGLIVWFAPVGRAKRLPDESPDLMMIAPARAGGIAALGLLAFAMLPTGQWLLPAAQHQVQQMGPGMSDSGAGKDRVVMITVRDAQVQFRPHELPVLGSPDAQHVVVTLMDYTCPNCRLMHRYLQEARQNIAMDMAIVMLPMPLDKTCNSTVTETEEMHKNGCEYAKLAMAVWKTAPGRFAEFDDFLLTGERPPTVEDARDRAAALVGDAGLAAALNDKWVSEQIQRNIRLYQLSQAGRIPVVFTGRTMMTGRPASAEEVVAVLEKEWR